MSEVILPPKPSEGIYGEALSYGQNLSWFVWKENFPDELLAEPDHIMVKAPTPSDFEKRVQSLKPLAAESRFLEIDSRFLVAFRMIGAVAIQPSKRVEMVEVMETRHPDSQEEFVGVEYNTFYYPNFNEARKKLRNRRIEYITRSDEYHRWINIRINNDGQEVRITDKRLAETLDEELDSGIARILQ